MNSTHDQPASMTPAGEAQHVYLKMLLDMGCKIRYRTVMFGKNYVWMTDRDGTYFLERYPDA